MNAITLFQFAFRSGISFIYPARMQTLSIGYFEKKTVIKSSRLRTDKMQKNPSLSIMTGKPPEMLSRKRIRSAHCNGFLANCVLTILSLPLH